MLMAYAQPLKKVFPNGCKRHLLMYYVCRKSKLQKINWISASTKNADIHTNIGSVLRKKDIAEWLYLPNKGPIMWFTVQE